MAKNKYFVDDGWAVWIDGNDTSTFYLNEWMNPGGKNYVDVGIRIRGVRNTRMMRIYVPFPVAAEEIEDISMMLNKEQILYAIFSAACLIDYQKNPYTSEIAYNGKTIDLVHLSKTDFQVQPLSAGSLVIVPLQSLQEYLDNDEAYFLFRIPHKSLDAIFKPAVNVTDVLRRLRDLVTSPLVSERYGYSLRVNEARMLPNEITHIGSFHRQKLRKAVVTISLSEKYEINDANCYWIRRLEKNLYQDYAPVGYNCEDVITYQWNRSRETNLRGHFNYYFNITREAISRTSMLIYMVLLLVFGSAGSALWDLIKFLFCLLN